MQYQLGNATLNLSFEHLSPEYLGDGWAEVSARQYLALREEWGFDAYGIDIDGVKSDLEDDKDAVVQLSADDLIVFLDAAKNYSGEYDITYRGIPYWFWHDTIHAERDVAGGSVEVSAYSERRALIEGAKRAREQGVSLGIIFRELVRAETAFQERFNKEVDAIESFSESLEGMAVV